ncbi:MAG: integrase [Candidatus Bathyarchaeia archaeon]
MRGWAEAYRIAERLVRGEAAAEAIVWNAEVKEKFRSWLEAEGRSREYILDCTRYLDRYVKAVSGPEDVVALFTRCERGKPHLAKAFRALLRFCEVVLEYREEALAPLRRAVPKARSGVDYREVSESAVQETFRALEGLSGKLEKYRLVWLLILDSGVRLSHAVRAVETFRPELLLDRGGFHRYPLGLERGVKHTWYVYMRGETAETLMRLGGSRVTPVSVFRFMGKMRRKGAPLTNPKLVRKFAYNKMLQVGVPESVADFICGRKPATVGARHYAWLVQQADAYYPKYASYLDGFLSRV